jgi:hypothetical protein
MNFSGKLHEDREIACRVLTQLISQSDDEKKIKILLYDFVHKYMRMRDVARPYYLSQLFPNLLPSNVAKVMKDENMIGPTPKPRADIAIMTIKKPELLRTS